MSIITLSLNSAIDQTVNVDKLEVGEVHRAKSVHYTAGGKGIMVASCLADWHKEPIAVTGFLGTSNAAIFTKAFADKNINNQCIMLNGDTRTNIKIVDKYDTTDINLAGLAVTENDIARLFDQLQQQTYDVAVLSGSIPPACPTNIYAQIIEKLVNSSTKVILDTSNEPLIQALNGTVKPYAVKPNSLELSQWAGRELVTEEDILEEAQNLLKTGIKLVVISMGSEGAFFIQNDEMIKAKLNAPSVLTTVGAGDSMVAGMATAIKEGGDIERIARLSTAFAVSKLGFVGAHLPEPNVVESFATQVDIKRRRLSV